MVNAQPQKELKLLCPNCVYITLDLIQETCADERKKVLEQVEGVMRNYVKLEGQTDIRRKLNLIANTLQELKRGKEYGKFN